MILTNTVFDISCVCTFRSSFWRPPVSFSMLLTGMTRLPAVFTANIDERRPSDKFQSLREARQGT